MVDTDHRPGLHPDHRATSPTRQASALYRPRSRTERCRGPPSAGSRPTYFASPCCRRQRRRGTAAPAPTPDRASGALRPTRPEGAIGVAGVVGAPATLPTTHFVTLSSPWSGVSGRQSGRGLRVVSRHQPHTVLGEFAHAPIHSVTRYRPEAGGRRPRADPDAAPRTDRPRRGTGRPGRRPPRPGRHRRPTLTHHRGHPQPAKQHTAQTTSATDPSGYVAQFVGCGTTND